MNMSFGLRNTAEICNLGSILCDTVVELSIPQALYAPLPPMLPRPQKLGRDSRELQARRKDAMHRMRGACWQADWIVRAAVRLHAMNGYNRALPLRDRLGTRGGAGGGCLRGRSQGVLDRCEHVVDRAVPVP